MQTVLLSQQQLHKLGPQMSLPLARILTFLFSKIYGRVAVCILIRIFNWILYFEKAPSVEFSISLDLG